MRRRLLVTVLFLVVLVVVGLGVPLGLADASTQQHRLFVDRLTDTVYFASIAQRPIAEASASRLAEEIVRYDDVYGVGVAVLRRDGTPLVASRPELQAAVARPEGVLADRLRLALANRRSEPYPSSCRGTRHRW